MVAVFFFVVFFFFPLSNHLYRVRKEPKEPYDSIQKSVVVDSFKEAVTSEDFERAIKIKYKCHFPAREKHNSLW